MSRRTQLKIIFYLNLATVALLVAYKVYLNFTPGESHSVHTGQVERIQAAVGEKRNFSFVVAGNINNSIGIFERKIIPALNASDIDFVISAGNAVRNGAEDKYRALAGTLSHLDAPYLLTFGENEAANFGAFRFYDRFGPYFFGVTAGNSRLLFLDTTGNTSPAWQLQWLEQELQAAQGLHVFMFMGHPPIRTESEPLFGSEDSYLDDPVFRERLMTLAEAYAVRAVFSTNLPVYERQQHGNTDYIITGSAGGLVLNDENSFHHVVKVDVNGDRVTIRLAQLDIGQYRLFRTLESAWFFFHALMYTGYANFLLIVSIFALVTIKLYTLIFIGRDYYPRFDIDPTPYRDSVQRVAMFTNNYLPFIGGVPIAIDRLRRALVATGRQVLVFAPDYENTPGDHGDSYRVPPLHVFGRHREFRLANIFHFPIPRRLRAFRPDIVHLHHPIWLCSLGLFLARRMKIPAVFTYHTRMEHYAHFVNLPDPLFRNLISHIMVRRFANKCDGVIVPTYSAEEYLRLVGVKSEIFVQPTGVEYERFRTPEPGAVAHLRQELGIRKEKVLVSVSRLSREKNIDFMVDCVHDLARDCNVPFRFVLIGDGDERARLEARIRERGLANVVILAGAVQPEQMPLYYALGDVFLFASKTETQGMVILEAMAAGLPVVAVRSSGIDDVVQDGVNGFKTPEDPGKWCRAVRQLLEEDDLRQRLAGNAVRFAKDYSVERFADNIIGIYAYLVARRFKQQQEAGTPPP